MNPESDIPSWINRQAQYCVCLMEKSISAVSLQHERPSFAHRVTPAPGSVLASPVSAAWNPEPDYFFHWVRDSAMVMGAIVDLWNAALTTVEKDHWRQHFEAFIGFSTALLQIDGSAMHRQFDYRRTTQLEFQKFLRPEDELRMLDGDRLLGEPRFNPDGTADFYQWSRPQYDGPALRALVCLRYAALCLSEGLPPPDELLALLYRDLDFTARHADEACIGPWEEPGELAHHYYVALTQLGAMFHGRAWMQATGDAAMAMHCATAEAKLRAGLEQHWSEDLQIYVAIRGCTGTSRDDGLDSAIILAVVDADLPSGRHSVMDERVQATVMAIEDMFSRELPINWRRPAGCSPALGRSRNDRYFGGGAWYPTTLGAARFYYRLADRVHCAGGGDDRVRTLIQKGDAVFATIRRYMPSDGSLSEQFDRRTGEQQSARHLAWSYAAFVSATEARRRARRAT